MFLEFAILIMISFLILIGIFFGVLTINGSGSLNYFGVIPIAIGICILLFFIFKAIGFEVDMIYEDGMTSRNTNLNDKIKHRSFVKYGRIKLVGTGTITNNRFFEGKEFLAVFTDDIVLSYINEHINEFYIKISKILKQKCPHVPWVEMQWLEWKKDGFSLDKLINENSPSCPYCDNPLTYIPEYDRWYCYNCREYAPEG